MKEMVWFTGVELSGRVSFPGANKKQPDVLSASPRRSAALYANDCRVCNLNWCHLSSLTCALAFKTITGFITDHKSLMINNRKVTAPLLRFSSNILN